MKPEIKEKWVAALRSGEYPQTKGILRDAVGYCCLGVLGDLFVQAHDGIEWDASVQGSFKLSDMGGILPLEVARWAGLKDGSPEVARPGEVDSAELTALNDSDGLNFNEIANLIEEQL